MADARLDKQKPKSTPDSQVPRPSATLILVRGERGREQVLMVRRHRDTAFGNLYAFPGGVIEASDSDAPLGPTADDLDERLQTTDGHRFYNAAIRETWEETGIFIGRGTAAAAAAGRATVLGGAPLTSVCQQHRLVPELDRLHYVAHWVTPLGRPRRYSTRFFLTEVGPEIDAEIDGNELVDAQWLTPEEALAGSVAPDFELPRPTYAVMEDLVAAGRDRGIVRWAEDRWRAGIPRFEGTVRQKDGAEIVTLPDNPGYSGFVDE